MRLLLLSLLSFSLTALSAQTVLALQDYDTPSTFDSYVLSTPDCTNGGDSWTSTAVNANPDGLSNVSVGSGEIFFIRDLDGDCGSSAGETITFTHDVTGETDVRFTFDYDIVGLDGGDVASYTLTVDGSELDAADIVTGGTGGVSGSGTITLMIPDGSGTVILEIFADQNGGSDYLGFDNFQLASFAGVCGVTLDFASAEYTCDANTAAADGVTVNIPYTGVEAGVTLTSVPALTNTGDDPATVSDGTITFALTEGITYDISYTSAVCGTVGPETIGVAADFCEPLTIFINEFLADPDSDVNGDGAFDASDDEFVELFNTSTDPVDIGGWTIADGNSVRHVFPAGTMIDPEGFITVFGGGTVNKVTSSTASSGALGLNNGGDVITLANASGTVMDEVSYSGSTNDVSEALSPDGNKAGGFVDHTAIDDNPVNYSPDASNQGLLLPIDLLSLSAAAMDKSVQVKWSTATESENDFFAVERSLDGQTFSEIGRVASEGTTTEVSNYSFMDENPANGTSYYRLRQVDLGGSQAIYGPVAVSLTGLSVTAYPNPAAQELFLAGLKENTTATVLDISGRVLQIAKISGNSLNVSQLQAGTYLLRLESETGTETLRFVRK
jgi:hypothetical protein